MLFEGSILATLDFFFDKFLHSFTIFTTKNQGVLWAITAQKPAPRFSAPSGLLGEAKADFWNQVRKTVTGDDVVHLGAQVGNVWKGGCWLRKAVVSGYLWVPREKLL